MSPLFGAPYGPQGAIFARNAQGSWDFISYYQFHDEAVVEVLQNKRFYQEETVQAFRVPPNLIRLPRLR